MQQRGNFWENDPIVTAAPAAPAGQGSIRQVVGPQRDDAPAGYRYDEAGNLQAIPGGPASGGEPPSGYRLTPEGNLEAIPGGPADPTRPTPRTRVLPNTAIERLGEGTTGLIALERALANFRDDYAGNSITGGLENTIQRRISGFGTPGQQDWWSDVQATDNTLRHALFGASLTAGEQRAWQQTTVSPDMAPDLVRTNLQRRLEIARAALRRQARTYRANGYNEEAIREALGERQSLIDEAPPPAGPGEDMRPGVGGVPLAHNLPPEMENPFTPQQQAAWDAFVAANPQPTREQFISFFQSIGVDPARANIDALARAAEQGARQQPGSAAQFRTPDISDVRGGGGVGETVDATMRAAGNALTAGLADRAAALGDTVFGDGTYDENVRRQHAITAYDWQQHPVASMVGTVGGAVILPTSVRNAAYSAASMTLRTGGTRAQAISAARNAAALRMAGESSAYGGFHGFTSSDGGVLDRLADATVESLVGAGTGGVLPYGNQVAGGVGRGVSSVFTGARGLADRIVFRAIRADGNTANDLARQVVRAEGDEVPMMLADTGENARGAMSAAARAPGAGRTEAIQNLDQRQDQLGDRLIGHIERDLGPVANPHQIADDLLTQAQTAAAPLYEAAYARPGADTFGQRVGTLLGRPSMRRAMQRARRIAEEEGRDPTTLGFEINQAGEVTVTRVPSWQTLDYIKRGMDDVVESYRDPTSGRLNLDTEGRAVNNTLRTFLRAFDEANPDYAAARAAYGGPVRGIDAMNRGRQALSMTADDLEAIMRDMTPFDRDMFRLGARRAMAEQIESRGDTANMVNALVGTGKKRAMLARLFGDRRQFERFVDTLDLEERGFQTFRRARTGSPTAPNQQDDSALAVATGVADLASSGAPIISALRIASRAHRGRQAEAAQQAIATMLGETNPDRIRALIARFRRAEAALLTGRGRTRAGVVTSRAAVDSTPEVDTE